MLLPTSHVIFFSNERLIIMFGEDSLDILNDVSNLCRLTADAIGDRNMTVDDLGPLSETLGRVQDVLRTIRNIESFRDATRRD